MGDHSAVGRLASVGLLPHIASRKTTQLSQHDRPLFFVGIDWAATGGAVCVLDRNGRETASFTNDHTAAGFARPAVRLSEPGPAGQNPVVIERPDGRLVNARLELGYTVLLIKPNAIKTRREAEVLSGAKSDGGDVPVTADSLRVRFHPRRAGDLVECRAAASKQLDAHRPGTKVIFADIESAIALAFPTRYPTAASASSLTENQLPAFWAQQGYLGNRPAAAVPAYRPFPRAGGKQRSVPFRWACNSTQQLAEARL